MTINVELSPAGVKKAQDELKAYKKQVEARVTRFLQILMDRGADVARVKFTSAIYDGTNDVEVTTHLTKNKATITASGKAVAFIEFGAGTSFPEHPSHKFKHGTYGKGQGSNEKGWIYKGEPGSSGLYVRDGVYRSHGNPPAEAMWDAKAAIIANIESAWREAGL